MTRHPRARARISRKPAARLKGLRDAFLLIASLVLVAVLHQAFVDIGLSVIDALGELGDVS